VWRDDPALPHLVNHVSPGWRNWVAILPDTLSLRFPDAPPVRVLHTFRYPDWDVVFPATPGDTVLPKLAGIAEEIIIYGHSHFQDDRQIGNWRILNPGSTGFPFDGIQQASYMILDGSANSWAVTFRRVAFDLAPIFEEYERQSFTQHCGVSGFLTIEELKAARHFTRPFHHWHDDHYPDSPETVEHAREFLDSGDVLAYTNPEYRHSMG
jgi:hypothetical protein